MEGRGVGAEFNIAYPHTDAFPIGKGGCSSDMFVDRQISKVPALSKRVPACFTCQREGWVKGGMLSLGNFRDQSAETMKMETVNIRNHEILTTNHTEAMMTFSFKQNAVSHLLHGALDGFLGIS